MRAGSLHHLPGYKLSNVLCNNVLHIKDVIESLVVVLNLE